MALGLFKKVFSFRQKKDEKKKTKHPAKPSQKKAAAPKSVSKAKNYKTTAKAAPQKQEKPKAAAPKVKSKTAAKTVKSVKAKTKAAPAKRSAPASAKARKPAPAKKTAAAKKAMPVKKAVAAKKAAPVKKASPAKKTIAVKKAAPAKKVVKAVAVKRSAPKAKPAKAKSVKAKPAHKPAVMKAAKAAAPKPTKAAISVTLPSAKAIKRKASAPVSFGSGKVSIGDILEVIESAPQSADEEPLAVIKISWFERLKSGLSRSSRQLGDSVGGILTKRKLDAETLQDLEDVLITADLGVETAMRITDTLGSGRFGKNVSTGEVQAIMADEIRKVLEPVAKKLELDIARKPHVILVVGVNGTGKTTTIGKLAQKLTDGGLSVMLAAGDTFRAAAIEQLHIWGERTGSAVVSSKLGADAASLAYDAYKQAKTAGSDVLIIDTAGRLQNKAELMDELAKIVRVLGKHDPSAPHTVLQTLDATTGQNALNQVDIFRNVAGVNGLVMTKLDGTARGGILVAIAAKHKLPVHFIGVGEAVDDLESFSAHDFAEAITGNAKT